MSGAFGLGSDHKRIDTIDADGIVLAALQARAEGHVARQSRLGPLIACATVVQLEATGHMLPSCTLVALRATHAANTGSLGYEPRRGRLPACLIPYARACRAQHATKTSFRRKPHALTSVCR